MNKLRWVTLLAVLALCCSLSYADSTLPDGNIGGKSGGNSTPITSLSQPFTFSPCAGATGDVAFDCALFGTGANAPQEIFAGINETGVAWNSLSISLTGLTMTDGTVGCDGGALFSINNCPITIPASGSVVVNFLQGTGTGIGCFNPALSLSDPTNVACFASSTANALNNTNHGTSLPYWNPPLLGGCNPPTFFPPGAVCGSDEFVIGVGFGGNTFNPNNIPIGLTLSANSPEPQTILLVGGAMISMLMLGLKKARLV
jgi:hypothetical protein